MSRLMARLRRQGKRNRWYVLELIDGSCVLGTHPELMDTLFELLSSCEWRPVVRRYYYTWAWEPQNLPLGSAC